MIARRGFTLLELGLATAMASMLLVTALGLFIALDRGDRRFEKRFDQVSDLDRLQTVLRRTFATLAVTDETAPPGTPGIKAAGANTPPPPTPSETANGSSASSSAPSRVTSVPSPRVRIVEDPDPTVKAMVNRSKATAGGGGGDVLSPQMLEVVTAGQPVPDLNPESEESSTLNYVAATQGVLLNRGAIYLRPMPLKAEDEEQSWEILYTRLAPRDRLEQFGAPLPQLRPIGEPIVLAQGIRYFNVRVFRERQWTRMMEATYFQHLPAYVQVEVETTTGLWAKWLFEVGWLLGPETQEERDFKSGGNKSGAGGSEGKDSKSGGSGSGPGSGSGSETIKSLTEIVEQKAPAGKGK